MSKVTDNLTSGLKISAILMAAALATGCISAKAKPTEEASAAEPAVTPAEPAAAVAAAPAASAEPMAEEMLASWTVASGEHLWGISAEEDVYNMAEMWPLIYKSNLDQIKDPDLIYPGQVLGISRDYSEDEKAGSVYHAMNRGAWTVGGIEASDGVYIGNPTCTDNC